MLLRPLWLSGEMGMHEVFHTKMLIQGHLAVDNRQTNETVLSVPGTLAEVLSLFVATPL